MEIILVVSILTAICYAQKKRLDFKEEESSKQSSQVAVTLDNET